MMVQLYLKLELLFAIAELGCHARCYMTQYLGPFVESDPWTIKPEPTTQQSQLKKPTAFG
jgi:hypothetical protein